MSCWHIWAYMLCVGDFSLMVFYMLLCNWICWFVFYSHAAIEYLHIQICVYCHGSNGPLLDPYSVPALLIFWFLNKPILINARMGAWSRLLHTLMAYWCVIYVCVLARMGTYIGDVIIWCVLVILVFLIDGIWYGGM